MIRFIYQSIRKLWIKFFSGINRRFKFLKLGSYNDATTLSSFGARFLQLAFRCLILPWVGVSDFWRTCSALLMNVNKMYSVHYVNSGSCCVEKYDVSIMSKAGGRSDIYTNPSYLAGSLRRPMTMSMVGGHTNLFCKPSFFAGFPLSSCVRERYISFLKGYNCANKFSLWWYVFIKC